MRLFVSALEYSANIHLRYLLGEIAKLDSVEICGIFDEKILDFTRKSGDCGDFEYCGDSAFCDSFGGADSKRGDSACVDSSDDKDCGDFSRGDSAILHTISGKSICNVDSIAVMGFIDVLKKMRFFINLNKTSLSLALKADKILLMDSSSFNIPLAKRIKKRNPHKKIAYYILPQVWAWKPWRAKAIEKNCDILAAILPFEVQCYKKKAKFAGHPLLDEIRYFKNCDSSKAVESSDFADSSDLNKGDSNIFAFMPGSRKAEIERIFPVFIEVKDYLKKRFPNASFHLIIPQKFKGSDLWAIYENLNDFIISFDAHKSLFYSKFAFICSGTATLECALIGTPFVLGYKCRAIEAFIARRFLNIKYIGLANLLYEKIRQDETFHIELVQEDLNVKNLINAFESAKESEFIEKSLRLRAYLKNGSAKAVARWLYDL